MAKELNAAEKAFRAKNKGDNKGSDKAPKATPAPATASEATSAAPAALPTVPTVEAAIVLEDGVAMPEARSKYPFGDMKIGQSFAVPTGKHNSVRTCAHGFQTKNKGFAFSIQQIDDGAYRCWRVKADN